MSESADQINYRDIWDRNGPHWSYLLEEIPELYRRARELQRLHQMLQERADGLSYRTLQRDGDYEQVLLGGVESDGSYADDSFAQFVRAILGLQFEDHQQAVARSVSGAPGDASVVVEKTAVMEFVESLVDSCETIIEQIQIIGEERLARTTVDFPSTDRDEEVMTDAQYRDTVTDPEALTECLASFLEAMQAVLPNYDARAQFVVALNHCPCYYLEQVYPDLTDAGGNESAYSEHYGEKDVFDSLDNLFGLTPVFTPDVPDETKENKRLRHDFTLYSYRDGSIGAELLSIYDTVWGAFERQAEDDDQTPVREAFEIAFPNLRDFKWEYINQIEGALEEAGEWTRPEFLKDFRVVNATEEERKKHREEYNRRRRNDYNTYPSVRDTTKAEYEISGLTVTACDYRLWGHTQSGRKINENDVESVDRPLTDLLFQLAPTLCYLQPVQYRLDIDEDRLEVSKL